MGVDPGSACFQRSLELECVPLSTAVPFDVFAIVQTEGCEQYKLSERYVLLLCSRIFQAQNFSINFACLGSATPTLR
jgi:hypothetical protein